MHPKTWQRLFFNVFIFYRMLFSLEICFLILFFLTFKNLFEQNLIQVRQHSARSSWECSTDRSKGRTCMEKALKESRKVTGLAVVTGLWFGVWRDCPWAPLGGTTEGPPHSTDVSGAQLPVKRGFWSLRTAPPWAERAFLLVRTWLKGPEASLHPVLTASEQ